MQNSVLLTLAGTSLLVLTMLYVQVAYAGGGSVNSIAGKCDAVLCQVEMADSKFVPFTLTARPLADIVWINNDNVRHTVTSGSEGSIEAPLVSRFIEPGENYEFSFQSPGKYNYFCQTHPYMQGIIIVEGTIVPEFPSIALLIAAAAVVPIVAMTRLRKSAFKIGI